MAGWQMWRVRAYTGKNRNINLGDSFVRADTEQRAMELGKSALRVTGVRGAYRVEAVPYHPWTDWAFAGFVRQQPPAVEGES